jgi:hypothetical protein
MSLTYRGYKKGLHEEPGPRCVFGDKLEPLSGSMLEWMSDNNKEYSDDTRRKFRIQQIDVELYDNGRRALSSKAIVIPVGPIWRCYVTWLPKNQRWRVIPTGHPAQWFGDLTGENLIICEGEWDCLQLHDQGFTNAITHTAGAMTWLPEWTLKFKNKRVFIALDRDQIGQRGAGKVAKILFPIAKEVRLIDLPLPGTPAKKDVTDYFKFGGTPDGFRKLIRNARYFIPRFYRAR